MSQISIPLSEEENLQVERDAHNRGFASVTDYVLHLIREAREESTESRLTSLVAEDTSSEWWSALQLSAPHFD